MQQQTTLLFLQTYPTPQAAMAAPPEQITQMLKNAGHLNPLGVTPKVIERLHQPQLQADAVITRTKSRLMLALVSQLGPLLEQIAQYDKEIHTLFFG